MIEYKEILQTLTSETGLNIDSIGLSSVKRGINQSMQKSGINNSKDFAQSISNNNYILQELIEELKVPETWFFRDVECYNYIKSTFVNHQKRYSKSNPLRMLSVPCSTGEEPYSAVMLAFENNIPADSIQIVACDISHKSLDFAKKGVFRKTSFRNDYFGFQEKYFTEENGYFKISEKVSNVPQFIAQNLVKNDFLVGESKFDFIFCKNLLIYLNDEARDKVLVNIKRLLKDDGVLLVGLSEINYFTRNGFEQIKHNMAFACRLSKSNVDYISDLTSIKSIPVYPRQKNVNSIKKSIKHIQKSESKNTVSSNLYTIENVKLLADKGDFYGAEKICNLIIQNEYTNHEALYYMGLIMNALKDSHKATEYFKKVLYLMPNHYESLIHISLIYESIGDSERSELYRSRAERVFLRNKINSGANSD